jgi:hypothetical protein
MPSRGVQNSTDVSDDTRQNGPRMLTLILIVLCLTGWAALAATERWHRGEAALGLMSERWLAEQRAYESHHRLT